MGDDIPWPAVTGSYKRGQTKLGTDSRAPITGAMALGAGERLVRTGGGDVASARAIDFRPVPLDLTASLDVSTPERPSTSTHVIGRLSGRGKQGERLPHIGTLDPTGIFRHAGRKHRPRPRHT